ncbi:MAG TPA: PIN domain-containing protein [Chloroflexota bacterium]|jgi:predicted nucleic acid-binding protein|nr:PIN domain-containing protein [Chloroflexota bacterium]
MPPLDYLDTNVFICHITQDDPRMGQQARALFKQLEAGQATATTCEGVIVEAVQVLSSRTLYNLPRPQIRQHLSNLLSLKGLRLPRKRVYLRALDLYATSALDFVDALLVAHMERDRSRVVISFDQDFDRLSQVTRRQP